MAYYSYLLDHDYGLAPNPFGGYCTLAVCKPAIRKSGNLKIGDWIFGTGSKAMEKKVKKSFVGKLIYAMQVEERIKLDQYWNDERFQFKKPITNGSLVMMFGDNFYHKDEHGKWIQEDSAHSLIGGKTNTEHLETDTGGENVVIGSKFYYFGDKAPTIPDEFSEICHQHIGMKKPDVKLGDSFLKWIEDNYDKGIQGDPINWSEFDNQSKLF